MRNIIFGTIGVLWGGAILLVSWFGSGSGDAKPTPVKSKSAKLYSAGQTCGNIFGFLFLGAGLFYLINGIREVMPDRPMRRRRKRKRLPRESEVGRTRDGAKPVPPRSGTPPSGVPPKGSGVPPKGSGVPPKGSGVPPKGSGVPPKGSPQQRPRPRDL
jgi:hypothetical protein